MYNVQALEEMALKNNGKIVCPETKMQYDFSELRRVYITWMTKPQICKLAIISYLWKWCFWSFSKNLFWTGVYVNKILRFTTFLFNLNWQHVHNTSIISLISASLSVNLQLLLTKSMSFPPHATSTSETKSVGDSLPTQSTPLNFVNELFRTQQFENVDTSSPLWCFFITLLSTFRSRTQSLKEIHRLLDDYFSKTKTLTEFLITVLTKIFLCGFIREEESYNFCLG